MKLNTNLLGLKIKQERSSHWSAGEINLTSTHEDENLIPGLTQWVKGSDIAMSCGIVQQL